MTVSPTTAKAAVAWIITAAKTDITAVTGHDLWIGYGEPIDTDPDDQFYLMDVESEAAMIGMRTPTAAAPMSETLIIPFRVSVFREDSTGQAAFERCADMVNAIVAAVRTDPTLGGAVLNAQPQRVTYPTPAAAPSGVGRVCETELTFDCLGTN